MKKRILYIIIAFLPLILFFTFSGNCFGGDAQDDVKEAVEDVGKSVQKATEEVKEAIEGDKTESKDVYTVEDKDDKEDSSDKSQSENVQSQDSQSQDRPRATSMVGAVHCKNEVTGDETGYIEITFDWEKNSVGGQADLIWYEYIEVSGEGGEEHHSHKYICRIECKTIMLGTIDKNNNIKASLSGKTSCTYGYDPHSEKYSTEICELCKGKFSNKLMIFTLNGFYKQDSIGQRASGKIVENGWEWGTGTYYYD